MLDITVVILTFNEAKHIERCINSLNPFVKRIVIVDSFSSDSTVEICEGMGVDVYQNEWVNYAVQFQWGLDHCNIDTSWTMRMDADEYVESNLGKELSTKLAAIGEEVNGIYLKRKVLFQDKWIKYGGFYPHILLRIWRTGSGRIEQRWMDEHIVLEAPSTVVFENDIVDHNLNDIGWWTAKHNSYSSREMLDLLNIKYGLFEQDTALNNMNDPQAKFKRVLKERLYSKLPLGVRPFAYFVYRYLVRGGFLDGKKGFVFHFLQAFWYRLLVDIKCAEVEGVSGFSKLSNAEKRAVLRDKTGINI